MKAESAREIWEAALGALQLQVSRSNYKTLLEKTNGLSCEDSHFVVGVPNTFIAEYLDKNQLAKDRWERLIALDPPGEWKREAQQHLDKLKR